DYYCVIWHNNSNWVF
nr:immunoglobulin light chain junction region [Macaca mulatta]MOX77992.1 immunoglobulin light chain junction region [Macaca mulatta]MOX78047.1 immunoglobulin light chain junction region [Macaca mulatta]MOX78383.1 immunoglobulin light chain junction region [Macaca mulatta]MOX80099.1 immunoglobulin light chain junction region [Macaca mulatta]